MAVKKKKSVKSSKKCMCGDDCHAIDSWLPGYLLMGFGLLALPINFGILEGMEWAKAWPLMLVLVGAALVVKIELCRGKSKK